MRFVYRPFSMQFLGWNLQIRHLWKFNQQYLGLKISFQLIFIDKSLRSQRARAHTLWSHLKDWSAGNSLWLVLSQETSSRETSISLSGLRHSQSNACIRNRPCAATIEILTVFNHYVGLSVYIIFFSFHTGQRGPVDQWSRDSPSHPSQHSLEAALFPSDHASWNQVLLMSKFAGAWEMGCQVNMSDSLLKICE